MSKISILSPLASAFSYSRTPAPTPLGLAVHLGWLGGDRASEATAIRALKEGKLLSDDERHGEYALANAFRQGSIMPPAWAHARSADTRVIGLSWTDESQLILTLPHSGIDTPGRLRGRRIALPVHDAAPFDHMKAAALRTILTVLSLDGLTHDDVEIVPVAANPRNVYEAEANALLHGDVDAIYVRGIAGLRIAKALQLETVIDLRAHPDPAVRNNGSTLRIFTANAGVLQRFPDVTHTFLRLVLDAAQWAKTHRDGAYAYAAHEAGVDASLVYDAYGPHFPENLDLNLADQSVSALADFLAFLAQWGFIERAIDVAQWVDYTPYREAVSGLERRTA